MKRRISLTTRISATSTSCSWPRIASRSSLTPVSSRTAPKTRNTQSKRDSAAAPRAMKMPRSTSAPMMPYSSTRCLSTSGTAKAARSSMKTNRLSTLNVFSTR